MENLHCEWGGKREKAFGILTRGRWGWCDDCGVPVLKSGGGGAWSSVEGNTGADGASQCEDSERGVVTVL
jgi:hypothetical protein